MAATTVERISIVETKVENLSEKVEELKIDIKQNRDTIMAQLDEMAKNSSTQHAELAKKISMLEKMRDKITWMIAGGVAIFGILIGHIDKVVALVK